MKKVEWAYVRPLAWYRARAAARARVHVDPLDRHMTASEIDREISRRGPKWPIPQMIAVEAPTATGADLLAVPRCYWWAIPNCGIRLCESRRRRLGALAEAAPERLLTDLVRDLLAAESPPEIDSGARLAEDRPKGTDAVDPDARPGDDTVHGGDGASGEVDEPEERPGESAEGRPGDAPGEGRPGESAEGEETRASGQADTTDRNHGGDTGAGGASRSNNALASAQCGGESGNGRADRAPGAGATAPGPSDGASAPSPSGGPGIAETGGCRAGGDGASPAGMPHPHGSGTGFSPRSADRGLKPAPQPRTRPEPLDDLSAASAEVRRKIERLRKELAKALDAERVETRDASPARSFRGEARCVRLRGLRGSVMADKTAMALARTIGRVQVHARGAQVLDTATQLDEALHEATTEITDQVRGAARAQSSLRPRNTWGGVNFDPKLRASDRPVARAIAREFLRLVERELGVYGETSPRIHAGRLVRELVGRSMRLSRARREEMEERIALVAVDVSGSCSSFSQALGAAIMQAADEDKRVAVLLHSNGLATGVYGEPTRGLREASRLECNGGASNYEAYVAASVACWDALLCRVGVTVGLGDWDALHWYERAAQKAPFVMLHNFGTKHGVRRAGATVMGVCAGWSTQPKCVVQGVGKPETVVEGLRAVLSRPNDRLRGAVPRRKGDA